MDPICKQFWANPTVNPRTNRRIKLNGPTYNKLVKLCGPPPTKLPAATPTTPPRSISELEKLPFEMIHLMIDTLSDDDVIKLCATNKTMRDICQKGTKIWHDRLIKDYPVDMIDNKPDELSWYQFYRALKSDNLKYAPITRRDEIIGYLWISKMDTVTKLVERINRKFRYNNITFHKLNMSDDPYIDQIHCIAYGSKINCVPARFRMYAHQGMKKEPLDQEDDDIWWEEPLDPKDFFDDIWWQKPVIYV